MLRESGGNSEAALHLWNKRLALSACPFIRALYGAELVEQMAVIAYQEVLAQRHLFQILTDRRIGSEDVSGPGAF